MFKFCSINLINTRLMLHLRQEMVYSTYFLALEVGQTFLRVFFEDQRHGGTNILTALVVFSCL